MVRFAVASLVALALAGAHVAPAVAEAPAPAASAAPAPPVAVPSGPLRRLVYGVRYHTVTSQEERVSGLTGGANPTGGGNAGVARTGSSSTAEGEIVLDVVAAAPDGLVIDVSENAQERRSAPIRMTLLNGGRYGIPPDRAPNLLDEELRIARLIARDFLPSADLIPGSRWNVSEPAPLAIDTTYTVTAVRTPMVDFTIDQTMRGTAGQYAGITGSLNGSAAYDAKKLAPVTARMHGVTRQQVGNVYTVTDTEIAYTLVSDTFGAGK